MIRDITLGQYFPGNSLIHRLDPRVKIVLIFAFIVFLFVAQNFPALLLLVAAVLVVMMLSGVPLRQYFKSIKAILFIVLFTSVLNLFYGGGETLLKIGFMEIKSGGVSNAVFIAVRIVSLILLSAVLTFTTSPTALTDAIERLMKPLKVFHVKVHEIAMIMTIALRFVPTLLEETDKIMSAQKARGADLESGGLMQRVKALLPILIPLFVSSFRRAYDLAMAMECRCYHGGEGRTKMKVLHAGPADAAASAAAALVCAAVVALNIFLPGALT
ncbi:MAG TPA: energy-coupling factor transporter transmembrane protein EcfT [Candidatus Caccousia avistercoris]|nr:energy-coupling factor transporter transmembrane protein EcfT [Candidatus Caccousia avistercoris]